MWYRQKCHECWHEWYSEEHDEICPVCGEEANIETDFIGFEEENE
jgi:rRNA maturation endonuclease Nob1